MTTSPFRFAAQIYRRIQARIHGVEIPADAKLGPQVHLSLGWKNQRKGSIRLGTGCELSAGVILHAYGGDILLRDRVFLGPHSVLYGHGGVELGEDTLVSMHCRILSSNHTVPVIEKRIRWEPDLLKPTKIGADVWLGAGVTVLGGVTIGDGCVVGAGAVVTRDLPPYSIAMGVPAVVTGKRKPARDSINDQPSC